MWVRGSPRAVGFYANGRLEGGVPLPPEGPDHYVVIREVCYRMPPLAAHHADPERTNNSYGHPAVVRAVADVARAVRRRHSEAPRLPIGELSDARGGMIPFHFSHQNGLDVDILFLQRPPRVWPGDARGRIVPVCHEGPRFEVAARGRWRVRGDFVLDWNWALVAAFAARPDVKVIFIGGLLRAVLGDWARHHVSHRERRTTMRKVRAAFCRPPPGVEMGTYRNNRCPHDDHIHVRFRCPSTSPPCREGRRRRRAQL